MSLANIKQKKKMKKESLEAEYLTHTKKKNSCSSPFGDL